MEGPSPKLLIVGACGVLVAAGVGAMAGAGLRVPTRLDPTAERVVVPTEDVFLATAPAYPSWAPEPLYPGAERDPMDEFAAAWDEALVDNRDSRAVTYQPPQNMPPPYEVWLEGEARPADIRRPDAPRGGDPRPVDGGRYEYQGYSQPDRAARPASEPAAAQDDKSRY